MATVQRSVLSVSLRRKRVTRLGMLGGGRADRVPAPTLNESGAALQHS
jgi:hypothetical protein